VAGWLLRVRADAVPGVGRGQVQRGANPLWRRAVHSRRRQAELGTAGIANIRDGRFDTAGAEGKGIAGGPTVVRVTGLSGPPDKGGKLICEYQYAVDLPRGDSTLTIEVPASAAAKKAGATPEN
jgi:hypothetical protein